MKYETIEISIANMLEKERERRNAELKRMVLRRRSFEEILEELRAMETDRAELA